MTAAELKDARLLLGMTQTELATAMGYSSFASVNRKEGNHVAITKQDEIIVKFLLSKNKKQTK